jgi:hypothetical protein
MIAHTATVIFRPIGTASLGIGTPFSPAIIQHSSNGTSGHLKRFAFAIPLRLRTRRDGDTEATFGLRFENNRKVEGFEHRHLRSAKPYQTTKAPCSLWPSVKPRDFIQS